ncbi:hypothetical protein N7540_012115 [Penicillium herquei]|nr:hypothetical protein N7540_012115 [Penicillium herquei]
MQPLRSASGVCGAGSYEVSLAPIRFYPRSSFMIFRYVNRIMPQYAETQPNLPYEQSRRLEFMASVRRSIKNANANLHIR